MSKGISTNEAPPPLKEPTKDANSDMRNAEIMYQKYAGNNSLSTTLHMKLARVHSFSKTNAKCFISHP